MTHFLTISILCIIASSVASLEGKPVMVAEVFRHGARTLIHQAIDYFSFTEAESLLPSGQRQHYNLGKLLLKKYPHLLDSIDPKDIYVRSSEPLRCTISLQAQMFSIFEDKIPTLSETSPLEESLPIFDEDQAFVEQVAKETVSGLYALPNGFFPFTYETKSIYIEDMLHVAPWNCKYIEARQNERMVDSNHLEVWNFIGDTINTIKRRGFRIHSMLNIAHFGESLFTMHVQGRDAELPEDLRYGGLIYNDTKFINDWFSTYYFVGAELERSLKIRNFLAQVIEWFQGVVNGTTTYKFAFLSGHETSYLALLNFYGIYNEKCLFENYKAKRGGLELPYPDCIFPEYASQIIYELYTDKEDPYVVFLYNGKPFKVCKQSTGPECKLKDFIVETETMLLNLTKQDVESYCRYGYKL